MDELTKVAVESFEQNNHFETLDDLELLTHKGYTLKDVIIVCRKSKDVPKIKFRWNSQKVRFQRLNLEEDFIKGEEKEESVTCEDISERSELSFCDFLDLCKKDVFRLVQIVIS